MILGKRKVEPCGTMWNPKTFEKMSQGDWSADKKEWCCTEHDACSQICHTWFAVIMQVGFSLRLKYGSRRLEAGFQNKYFQVLPSSEFDGVGRQTFLETTLRFLCAQDKGCEADEPYDCRAGVLTSGLTTKQTWDWQKSKSQCFLSEMLVFNPLNPFLHVMSMSFCLLLCNDIYSLLGRFQVFCESPRKSHFSSLFKVTNWQNGWSDHKKMLGFKEKDLRPLRSIHTMPVSWNHSAFFYQYLLLRYWCCKRYDVACPHPATNWAPSWLRQIACVKSRALYGKVVYDCDAGYTTWQKTWSTDKKVQNIEGQRHVMAYR